MSPTRRSSSLATISRPSPELLPPSTRQRPEYRSPSSTRHVSLSGNPAPVPWAFEYLYPPFGIQIRQLMPAVIADANDPLPVNWDVANNVVGGTTKKVIHTNLANAEVVFSNQPDESTWDPGFREAVVRLLSSELAIALSGRPDTAQVMIKTGEQFEQLFTQRDS